MVSLEDLLVQEPAPADAADGGVLPVYGIELTAPKLGVGRHFLATIPRHGRASFSGSVDMALASAFLIVIAS